MPAAAVLKYHIDTNGFRCAFTVSTASGIPVETIVGSGLTSLIAQVVVKQIVPARFMDLAQQHPVDRFAQGIAFAEGERVELRVFV